MFLWNNVNALRFNFSKVWINVNKYFKMFEEVYFKKIDGIFQRSFYYSMNNLWLLQVNVDIWFIFQILF